MSQPPEQHPYPRMREYAVDGLTPPERRALEQHLATCATCTAYLRSLQMTATLLGQLSPPPLPRSFLLPATTPRRIRPRLAVPLRFLSAAAVLFLALGLSLALPQAPVTTSSGATAPAAQETAPPAAVHRSAAAALTSTSPGTASAQAAAAPGRVQAARVATSPTAHLPPPAGVRPAALANTLPRQPRRPIQMALAVGGIACLLLALGTGWQRLARRRARAQPH